MAAEWRLQNASKESRMARKVCSRVYETIDDFAEEVQSGGWEYDSPLQALDELRERLTQVLPFDPEDC